jgi:hypothetical protein
MVTRRLFLGLLSSLLIATPGHTGPQINKYLPSPINADLEMRYRLEYRSNYDFNDAQNDSDAFHLYRTRLNLKYTPIKPVHLFIQGQDARVSNLSKTAKAGFENFMDVRQLYLNYEDTVIFDPLGMNKLSLRAGRQEFSYGGQRLIGGFNWSNVAQTFDGGKVGFHFAPLHMQFDIFAGDKTLIKTPREQDDLFDGSSKERIYAYYAAAKVLHGTMIDNYLIHRTTWKNISFGPSGLGEVDNYTFGGRVTKTLPNRIDYEIETAGQWGNFRDKKVRATMAVGILGYTFDHKWQPRVAFEYDYASGDSDPTDETFKTFDNLYPTNHLFYGYMDFISLQNLNEYSWQLSVKPNKKLKLQSDLHLLFLDTPKDSWYSAGRTVTRTASSALTDVSSHVGDEVDLLAQYKFNNYVNVTLGYSHFFPGKYMKQTGAHDDADFVYFQTQFSL